MTDLSNKIALVTGASRGIGRAIALALSRKGVKVAVNFHSSEEEANYLCKEIEKEGGIAFPFRADVSEPSEVENLIANVEDKLGRIDILVNNAGIAKKQPIEDVSVKDFDSTIKTNLRSGFLVSQAVLPSMRKQKWGRLVFISSVAAQTGGVVAVDYAASKAGQLGIMRHYAKNLAAEGITSNAISPALIETDMVKSLEGVNPEIIPVKRFGKVEEVASLALEIVSNAYINGQTFNIDGGMYPT